MKESVLVIDISSEVATSAVVVVENSSPRIPSSAVGLSTAKDSKSFLKNLTKRRKTGAFPSNNSSSLENLNDTSAQRLSIAEIHALSTPDPSIFKTLESANNLEAKELLKNFFSDLVGGIKTPFDGCLLILPSVEHLSFNLSLPFTDKRNLNRIIDLEIQDTTPFDLDEFLIDYKIASKKNSGESNIFVNCINKKLVENLLGILKNFKVDPHCITLPAGTLSGLLWAVPNLNEENLVLLYSSKKELSLLLCSQGNTIGLKTIPLNETSIILLTQFLTSQEISLEIKFDEIILVGDVTISKSISENLKSWRTTFYDVKKYTNFSTDNTFLEVISQSDKDNLALTLLGSQLVIETPSVPILSNFRTREFAFFPKLKEFKKAWLDLLPVTVVMLFVVAFCMLSYYLIREKQIEGYRTTLQNGITSVVPGFSAPESLEVDSLQKELKKLDQQLKDLGSSSALTPLQSFAALSREIPSIAGTSIRKLSITPNKILIEGSAPDYSAVEKIERMLKRNKDAFCRIKKDTGATAIGQTDKRSFNFDIAICDNNNRDLGAVNK